MGSKDKAQQGIVVDERGQNQPADKRRALQTSSRRQRGLSDPPLSTDNEPAADDEAQRQRYGMQGQDGGERLLPTDRKNQIVRSRGSTGGEAGANEPHGFAPKPMLDERRGPGVNGLRGPDKQQGDLRDAGKGTYSQPAGGSDAGERTPHQDAQWGADVRGQPSMVQREDDTPEGLKRERKSPYDSRDGLNEEASQVPKNWTGKR